MTKNPAVRILRYIAVFLLGVYVGAELVECVPIEVDIPEPQSEQRLVITLRKSSGRLVETG